MQPLPAGTTLPGNTQQLLSAAEFAGRPRAFASSWSKHLASYHWNNHQIQTFSMQTESEARLVHTAGLTKFITIWCHGLSWPAELSACCCNKQELFQPRPNLVPPERHIAHLGILKHAGMAVPSSPAEQRKHPACLTCLSFACLHVSGGPLQCRVTSYRPLISYRILTHYMGVLW